MFNTPNSMGSRSACRVCGWGVGGDPPWAPGWYLVPGASPFNKKQVSLLKSCSISLKPVSAWPSNVFCEATGHQDEAPIAECVECVGRYDLYYDKCMACRQVLAAGQDTCDSSQWKQTWAME